MRISSPLTRTSPLFGVSSRLMQRRKVDLPEPEEPRIATTSCSWAVSEMPLSTSCAPKVLWMSLHVERDGAPRSGIRRLPSPAPRLPRLPRRSDRGAVSRCRPSQRTGIALRRQSKRIAPRASIQCCGASGSRRGPARHGKSCSRPDGASAILRGMDPLPTLCRDCLTAFDAPGRCPACRSPRTLCHPELRTPRHRPSRLRRLLRLGREARRPEPPRPAGHRRRRQARRRLHRLLHRPHQAASARRCRCSRR